MQYRWYSERMAVNGCTCGKWSATRILRPSRGNPNTCQYFSPTQEKIAKALCGLIASDGRTLALAESGNGYTTGEILPGGGIQLTHLADTGPFSVALDELKKV